MKQDLNPTVPADADMAAAAAHWHTQLDEDGVPAGVRAQLDAWLAADPEHPAALQAMDRMWSHMGAAGGDARILELRREALGATRKARRLQFAAAAACVLVIGAAAVMSWQSLSSGETFRTAAGERSTVMLSDGSSVTLNIASRIDVRFSEKRRDIRLVSGQAWFQVASDPGRPFVVEAADRRVRALGTAFDVRIASGDSVQVTLAEGRVSVEPIRSVFGRLTAPVMVPAELTPGETLVMTDDAPVTRRKADPAKVGSWRDGRIVFDNDTLEAAVAEINRYSPARIEIADPALRPLRLSGVFVTGHSESFIQTVIGHFPIQVSRPAQDRVVLSGKPAAE